MKKIFEPTFQLLKKNNSDILNFNSTFVSQGLKRDDVADFISSFQPPVAKYGISKSNISQKNALMTGFAIEDKSKFDANVNSFISENGSKMINPEKFRSDISQVADNAQFDIEFFGLGSLIPFDEF